MCIRDRPNRNLVFAATRGRRPTRPRCPRRINSLYEEQVSTLIEDIDRYYENQLCKDEIQSAVELRKMTCKTHPNETADKSSTNELSSHLPVHEARKG